MGMDWVKVKWQCYPSYVEITINIPEELAHQVASEGKDPARVALEALAVDGYRRELLSESALRRMLGFQGSKCTLFSRNTRSTFTTTFLI